MKVLVAHNVYQQPGGEDVVFEQESKMLSSAGVEVRQFSVRNDHIQGLTGKIAAGLSVIANKASIAALEAEVSGFCPDIVHFHNFFPRSRQQRLTL